MHSPHRLRFFLDCFSPTSRAAVCGCEVDGAPTDDADDAPVGDVALGTAGGEGGEGRRRVW